MKFTWLRPLEQVLKCLALLAVLQTPSMAQTPLISAGSVWKYRDDGSDLGTSWRSPAFNDTSWATGAAILGYGDPGQATTVSYGPDAANKYITTYFRRSFSVATPSLYGALTLRLVRDDGAVVYLNGTEVFRSNMPGGMIAVNTLASSAVSGTDETNFFTVNIPASGLVSGANLLAVEVHQNIGNSSDLSFDFELIGQPKPEITRHPANRVGFVGGIAAFSVTATGPAPLGYQWRFNSSPIANETNQTLSLVNLQSANIGAYTVAVSSFSGSVTSTVASLNVLSSAIVINEFLTSSITNLVDPADGHHEDWIELYNPNPTPVDLSGWHMTDLLANSNKWTIPNGTVLAAGAYALVWADNETAQSGLHANFILGIGGEDIGLSDPGGFYMDSLTYLGQSTDVSSGRWPNGTGPIRPLTRATPGSANAAAIGQPIVLTISKLSSDTASIVASGEPGDTVIIEVSENLVGWTIFDEGMLSSPNGTFETIDAITETPRVYRAYKSGGQVYAVNVVAQIEVSVSPGFNYIANPLLALSNTAGSLLPSVPPGTRLVRWNAISQVSLENNFLSSWSDPTMTLLPGQGFLIYNPTASSFPINFVGEVPQGTLVNHLQAGYTLCSSIVPQSAALESQLGFPSEDGDIVMLWNSILQDFDTYYYIGDVGWIDEIPELHDPVPAVGQAFFSNKGSPVDWTRVFSVDGGGGLYAVSHGGALPPSNPVAFLTYSNNLSMGRVLDIDGVTPLSSAFRGQLYSSLSPSEASLTAVGTSVFFSSGTPAGYINAGLVSIPGGSPGQTVYLQLRAWHPSAGSTYEAAQDAGGKAGKSAIFSLVMPSPGIATLLPLANRFASFSLQSKPIINSQPQSVTVLDGANVVFAVTATGIAPLTYQWYFNETNAITGATASTLAVNNIHTNHVGNYRVEVSNPLGTTLSSTARLNLTLPGLTNLVWVPPGTFIMGSPANDTACGANESPQTVVNLTRGFWMSLREVTQAEYLAVRGTNPSQFSSDPNRPVERVSWNDALLYCAALTELERLAGRLPAGYTYRLPTEAEWEFVARAGSNTHWSFGTATGQLGSYAWYILNSGCQYTTDPTCASTGNTHPVATKLPNPWGFYDMHGNVGEWCFDFLGAYPGGMATNPLGLPDGSQRIFRAPAWDFGDIYTRSACRWGTTVTTAFDNSIGFRVVMARSPGETLVARGSEWKYLDQGIDLGTDWREPDFDDGSWPSGVARLGYGGDGEVTSMDFGPNGSAKYITYYFRHTFDLPNPFQWSSLNLRLLRDDGAVVYLNGAEIYRSNLPGGSIDFSTLAVLATAGVEEQTYQQATINPGYLVPGLNVLAVEVHQVNGTSTDLSFDLELSGVPANGAPVITQQPVSVMATSGNTVIFTTTAMGNAPLSYQWFRNGVTRSGAITPTLTINNVQPADAGTYTVQVSNAAGTISSLDATLAVNVPPAITTQPVSHVVLVGDEAFLTVVAAGPAPLTYQWFRHGVPLAGATGSTFSFSGAQITDSGKYKVVVTNPFGSVTSAAATLTVVERPVITMEPVGRTVPPGANVTLEVAARGSQPLAYQWQFENVNLAFGKYPAVTLTNIQFERAGSYRVIVSNPFGAATSQVAVVSVVQPPQITFLSSDTTVIPGQLVQLCVLATGPNLQYQWRKNGVNLPGQTTNCITLSSVSVANSGGYSVVIENQAGAVLSRVIKVRVVAPVTTPGDLFELRVPLPMTANGPVSGSTLGSTNQVGEPPHAGQPAEHSVWYTWTAPLTGIATFTTAGSSFDTRLAVYTGTSLLALNFEAEDDDSAEALTSKVIFNVEANKSYQIAIDGFGGEAGDFALDWSIVTTAFRRPVITSQPVSVSVQPDGQADFQVGVSGTVRGYQWFFEHIALPGETNAMLTIHGVQASDVGGYHVQVFGDGGLVVESLAAQLQIWTQVGVLSVDKVSGLGSPSGGGGSDRLDGPNRGKGSGGFISTGAPLMVGAGNTSGLGLTSTVGSGGQSGESIACGKITGASQWLLVQALQDGFLQVDTLDSTFDTVLAAYSNAIPGQIISDKKYVDCDDNSAGGLRSRLAFEVKLANWYWVAVDGVNGATGKVNLNWAFAQPPPAAPSTFSRYLVQEGRDATLRVGDNLGQPPPRIQWRWNETDLAAETREELTLSRTGQAQTGNYEVVLSNFAGRSTNMVALVTVAGTVELGLKADFINGELHFNVLCTASTPVVIEGSSDFILWTPIETNKVGNQSFKVTDPNSTHLHQRFYRARVWTPP